MLSWIQAVRLSARNALCLSVCALGCLGSLFAFQKPFRQYPGVEYEQFQTPPDYREPGEFIFARLMFPGGAERWLLSAFSGRLAQGLSLWTQDYPRADRHFSDALRRLTRIQRALRRAARQSG